MVIVLCFHFNSSVILVRECHIHLLSCHLGSPEKLGELGLFKSLKKSKGNIKCGLWNLRDLFKGFIGHNYFHNSTKMLHAPLISHKCTSTRGYLVGAIAKDLMQKQRENPAVFQQYTH